MTTRRPPVIPEIAKAYQNDPRTQLAMRALDTASAGAPVAQGKYGMADGVARMLSGFGGALMAKKMMGQYGGDETKTIADQQDILRRTMAAPPQPPQPPQGPPQGAALNPAAAAAALGAPAAPQGPPAGPPGLMPGQQLPPEVNPATIARTGGAPQQGPRPFGPSAVAPRNPLAPVPSYIATPEVEKVPDAPAPVARPIAPKAEGATRSRLLDAAYATIMNGNPYLFSGGQEMYRSGTEQQTSLDEKATERRQHAADQEFDMDKDVYVGAASQDRGNAYEDRRAAQGRNFQTKQQFTAQMFQHGEGETERAFQAKEKALDRAAARVNASIAASSHTGKPLSFTAAQKLAAHAEVLDGAERLKGDFKPEFVGHTLAGGGAVLTNRLVGGNKPMADWWQDYDSWVASVRHELYGSSLTNNEKQAFEKTIVTPRTDAGIATERLEKQRAIAATGLARMSRSAAVSYGLDAVNEAIGRDATSLSTTAVGTRTKSGSGGAVGKTGDPLVDKYLGAH